MQNIGSPKPRFRKPANLNMDVIPHPEDGRNSYNIIPWNIFFCNKFCISYRLDPPEDSLAMLLPLACPFLQETSQGICFVKRFFVIITKLIVTKHLLCKEFSLQ